MGVMLAALLTAAVVQSPASATSADSGAEFSRLEDVWNEAHLHGDADALDRIMSANVVVIVPKMPAFTKAEALSVFRTGRMKFGRYATSGLTVRRFEGCVIVTGMLNRSRSMGERVVDDSWRFTKVYVRSSQGWQVVAFHASAAGQ